MIRFAALVAQVHVIDLEQSLVGHRICEGSAPWALNVLGLARTRGDGSIDIRNWGHDSFHPNALGHQLMGATVLATLRKYSGGTLPPLPQPPPPGITPPPYVPPEVGPPVGPYDFPTGTACNGREIVRVIPVASPMTRDA